MKTVWITNTRTNATSDPVPGYQVVYHPLLTIAPPSQMPRPPRPDDILVFTSPNGVAHFCAFSDQRDWHIYTVGDATAQAAKHAGFSHIRSAGKDVETLAALINKTVPKSESLYYASGKDVSGDLAGRLAKAGYKVERAIFYQTLPCPDVPAKQLDFILLYSRKGAIALKESGYDTSKSTLVSISENVDSALGNIDCLTRKTAENPNHNSMLKCLDRP